MDGPIPTPRILHTKRRVRHLVALPVYHEAQEDSELLPAYGVRTLTHPWDGEFRYKGARLQVPPSRRNRDTWKLDLHYDDEPIRCSLMRNYISNFMSSSTLTGCLPANIHGLNIGE